MESILLRFVMAARNIRSKELFLALDKYCCGIVLDVGGADFIHTIIKRNIDFSTWITLDISTEIMAMVKNDLMEKSIEKNVNFIIGNGCEIPFKPDFFDTIINIQVLEHVYQPIIMVKEISRVLKPSGHVVFLIPQTATIHAAPNHYYNFTPFWIEKVFTEAGLDILDMKPLGGIWSSMASHLVFFFFQSIKYPAYTTKFNRRNIFFFILYPIMILYAIFSIPICLFLSLGDLAEEPNNFLIVATKKATMIGDVVLGKVKLNNN